MTSQLRPLWWPWWLLQEVDLFPKSVFKCPLCHWDAFIDLFIYVFIFWLYSHSNKQLTYHQVKTRHTLMQIIKYWKIQKQICKSPKLSQPLMISNCILTLFIVACMFFAVRLPSVREMAVFSELMGFELISFLLFLGSFQSFLCLFAAFNVVWKFPLAELEQLCAISAFEPISSHHHGDI